MATRNEQGDVGERRRIRLEQRRQKMAFQVVNPKGWHLPGISEAPGQGCASQQSTNQPRTRGISDPVEVRRGRRRLCEDATDQGKEPPDVVPGSQLRHHPPVNPVKVDLTEELVRQKAAIRV